MSSYISYNPIYHISYVYLMSSFTCPCFPMFSPGQLASFGFGPKAVFLVLGAVGSVSPEPLEPPEKRPRTEHSEVGKAKSEKRKAVEVSIGKRFPKHVGNGETDTVGIPSGNLT